MSETLERVRALVDAGRYRVSVHGYEELQQRGILLRDLVESIHTAMAVEDYPDAWKGPSILTRQTLADARNAHAIWGLSKWNQAEAVLVTAYLPDPDRWTPDFLERMGR